MTACGQVFNDMHGGPMMRCGRSPGHGGPHDPIAMPRVLVYLLPPPVPFAWEITPADADIVLRALDVLGGQIWATRRGQSREVMHDRDRIAALRLALIEARAKVSA